MFGREYANHLDILNQSFAEMNEKYENKLRTENKSYFIEKLKKLFIGIFGIPEIGFQIRSLYFQDILYSHKFSKTPQKILDAGSGIGTYTFYLSKMFPQAQVVGGEIDKKKLRAAHDLKKKVASQNVTFISLDVTKKQKTSQYDLIVIIDVLEHIENYEKVLKNLYKLLRKNGYLYIHVPQPNQKRIFKALKFWHHEDHAHEGIEKRKLRKKLQNLGFELVIAKETFGFFGKLAWELNHLTLAKNFMLAGILYPFLYILAKMDVLVTNSSGLGIAVLAKKIH